MATVRVQHIDPWSFYDYKPNFGGTGRVAGWEAPTWVGDNLRRLQAYKLLHSYMRNSARWWLDISDMSEEDVSNRREYGDPKTIVDTALSSLLGNDMSLFVEQVDVEQPDQEAVNQFLRLNQWMVDVRFQQKVWEGERHSCSLGDNCYVLAWNAESRKPKLYVYDPGFYFPVLSQDITEEFPTKVHIAWEYDDVDVLDGKTKTFVRRMTWNLGMIVPTDIEGNPIVDFAEMVSDAGLPVDLGANERFVRVPDGSGGTISTPMVERLYAWNVADKETKTEDTWTTTTCYFSDMIWRVDDVSSTDPDWPATNAYEVLAEHVDLQLDFLPVVHVPCTISEEEHFGMSVLANIMQIMDDLVATDTDLQAASATTGTPPLLISGASLKQDSEGKVRAYGPGEVIETGDGGGQLLDTSTALDALLKYDDHLLSRMSVNGRIPEALLGRVKPNEVPSGIALTLSFSPHSNLVREMRLVRSEKYALLFKFVSRMFLADNQITRIFPANLVFGSFLPADRQETMTMVQNLLTSKAISLETAVRMLKEAGFPIEEEQGEISLIRSWDFGMAQAALDATGDINFVRQAILGLPPIELPTIDTGGGGGSEVPPAPPA